MPGRSTAATATSFYKGIVQGELTQWPGAAPTFSVAMRCFIAAAAAARTELAALQASDQPEVFKTRQGDQKTIATPSVRQPSPLTTPPRYGRTGRKATALAHIDIAIGYDTMREKAEALRKLLSR